MGRWMLAALPELFGDVRYDVVVPIPLHWRRRLWRGYNQAELLALPIAQGLGCPLLMDIGRRRQTRAQARLSAQARRSNLEDAFVLSRAARARVEGRSVLVVDDVFTTGVTTHSLRDEENHCSTGRSSANGRIGAEKTEQG
jgi:ComF family protein